MKRWHDPREHALMFCRWKFEMELHGYDWRNPPDPKCDRHVCHCVAGIGSMRKTTPLTASGYWKWYKHFENKRRVNAERAAIQFELDAG
jgi:hypothetical protein